MFGDFPINNAGPGYSPSIAINLDVLSAQVVMLDAYIKVLP